MVEQTEVSPEVPRPQLSAIDTLRIYGFPKVEKLVRWFPSPTRRQEHSELPPDELAAVAADHLGRIYTYTEAIDGLDRYRPQDGGTTAGNLGITQDEAIELVPWAQKASHEMYQYIDQLIDVHLGKNYELVASKLKTVGQTLGFQQKIFRVNSDQKACITLEFSDNSKPFTDAVEGVIYVVSNVVRSTKVKQPTYHDASHTIHIQLPTRIKEE